MNVSILFRTKNRVRAKIFRTFRDFFSNFSPSRKFCRRPNFFQNLADSAAIRLVQKSSKSEPSLRFFSHLKFRKSLPVSVLPKFPRRIQNRNGHIERWLVRLLNLSIVDRLIDPPIDRFSIYQEVG